ncbi:choline/carnitine O-acyltransferase [Phanerochaete sordida]|uniref:Choline/carnitine O-acyltransferase n=1 Tax=Phanerochaete sordida TaxID=48140 RepID=A0A9P3LBJ2_9APHY|nr:choline/carnitine O-acyltransferase [Phanerochaete sordida]
MLRVRTPSLRLSRSFRYLMSCSNFGAPSGTRTIATTATTANPPKPRLPRLPVPDLHRTLQAYLTSLEPFLLEDQAKGAAKVDEALALRKRWTEDFEHGLGSVLQERLKEALDRASPNNWLDDSIWLKKAYHEWRSPLLVHSNWWLALRHDQGVPGEVIRGTATGEDIGGTGVNRWQIRRAAWFAWRVLQFKAQLQREEIYPESTKTGIWFRKSADKIFNTCRIPRPVCDQFSEVPTPAQPSARTLLVAARDWFYILEVVDEQQNPVSPAELERILREVAEDVSRRLEEGESAVPISVLSADHRDRWAENYAHLMALSPQNEKNLTAIHHAIFALSLDHYTYTLTPQTPNSPLPTPDSTEEVEAHLHNLRSAHSAHPARNRWFDKPLTLIVEANTRAGAMGEHSPVDALIPSVVCDYAVVQDLHDDYFGGPPPTTLTPASSSAPRWRRLDFVVDDRIRRKCVEAEERARKIVDDSDDSFIWFDTYGATWIQKEVKLSPDAFIQMAMQLAWYRTRGSFTATYETALTRLFNHGRTETVRTLSADSRAWVLAMDDPSVSGQTRLALLRTAIKSHNSLTRAAMTGRGIDRHLLGLRCMLREGERHEVFEDELFVRSQTWKLSTSGLSAGDQFRGTGFGSPEHDGYGVNYMTGPDMIKFGIESKRSCPETSTAMFKAALLTALFDMQRLCTEINHAHL